MSNSSKSQSNCSSNDPQPTKSASNHGRANCGNDDKLDKELRDAIRHMVDNISKSFIVEWYTTISQTNHDFVASCETLIEDALIKFAELCITKLDKYKTGQLVAKLLHEHIMSDNLFDKIQSINAQIDDHEYDICQNSVVRVFGLLCTENLSRVIFTSTEPVKHNRYGSYHGGSLNSRLQSSAKTFNSPRARLNSKSDSTNDKYETKSNRTNESPKSTSALYTLVIAMLTKSVFMPIVDSISDPKWLYAVIIWFCKKEQRERAKAKQQISYAIENSQYRNNTTTTNPIVSQTKQVPTSIGATPLTVQHTTIQRATTSPPATTTTTTSIMVTDPRGLRSGDVEDGIDITSANINFENPVCDSLKRPLDNIEIYATEEAKSSNSCYALYCISYDGLYYRHPSSGFSFEPDNPSVPVIDKRASTISSNRRFTKSYQQAGPSVSKPVTGGESELVTSGRKYFRRKLTIKRRFREFVILQLRLEENPKLRPHMKHIPKPTKLKAATQNIFSLPGITNLKLDQSTIKFRQRFLERFLIALNNSPFIANSYEFKEFFSYNVNSSINISKSKSLILQVNLNKVFVDSVRSAFSILRSTLPGENYNLSSNPDPDAWLTELQQSTLKLHVQTRTSHSKTNLEKMIDSKLFSMSDPTLANGKACSLGGYYKTSGSSNQLDARYSRGGSLRAQIAKSDSASTFSASSSQVLSRTDSSSSNSYPYVNHEGCNTSRSNSVESIYYDAHSDFSGDKDASTTSHSGSSNNHLSMIRICDSVPIASKLIDIVHYSISKNTNCSSSCMNVVTRLLLGKKIERYFISLLESALNVQTASFCINGITSSIWDQSEDEPALELDSASLDEAVVHLSRLLLDHYHTGYAFIPRKLVHGLLSKQLRFYLSQLASRKRNKFFIYSFFVHLLDELES